jgi:hypothetical protein
MYWPSKLLFRTFINHFKVSYEAYIKVKVNLFLCFFLTEGEWRYSAMHSLTLALDGGEWSASHPGCFTPKERAPGTHWIGGWVGPSAVLEAYMEAHLWTSLSDEAVQIYTAELADRWKSVNPLTDHKHHTWTETLGISKLLCLFTYKYFYFLFTLIFNFLVQFLSNKYLKNSISLSLQK